MTYGVDYAFGKPATWASLAWMTALKTAGVTFAGRYVSSDPANDANGKKNYSNTGSERHRGIELAADVDLGSLSRLHGLSAYGAWTEMRNELLSGPNKGNWPPNAGTGVVPIGMSGYMKDNAWTQVNSIGGRWNWTTRTSAGRTWCAEFSPCSILIAAVGSKILIPGEERRLCLACSIRRSSKT